MENVKLNLDQNEQNVLLNFLKKTKDGEYTTVDQEIVLNQRVEVERETSCNDDYFVAIYS